MTTNCERLSHSQVGCEMCAAEIGSMCVCVYLQAWVGYEPGVVTQVSRVVLHHALGLWLTQVLIWRRETTSRQHHCGTLCGIKER